jgi:hypothetical protein
LAWAERQKVLAEAAEASVLKSPRVSIPQSVATQKAATAGGASGEWMLDPVTNRLVRRK